MSQMWADVGKKEMQLGDTIYYIDFNDKCVKSGVIIDLHITTSGYSAYLVKTSDGLEQKEVKITFKTQEQAEKRLKVLLPLAEKLEKCIKKCNEESKKIRQQILGKPDKEELCKIIK